MMRFLREDCSRRCARCRTKQLCLDVFQKLEDYAMGRHSNIVSIFRDFDKDQSGKTPHSMPSAGDGAST